MTKDLIILGVLIFLGTYFFKKTFKSSKKGNYLHEKKKMNNLELAHNNFNNSQSEYVYQNKNYIMKDCSEIDKNIFRMKAEEVKKGVGENFEKYNNMMKLIKGE